MTGWVLWAIVSCLFAIGEMLTLGFFLAPFAVGGASAAIVDGAGAGGLASWGVFVGVSLLALGVVRPISMSHRRVPPRIRTGSAALVVKQEFVVERIANREGVGCVKIDGE